MCIHLSWPMFRIGLDHDCEREITGPSTLGANQLRPDANARRHNARGSHSVLTICKCLSNPIPRRLQRRSPLRKCGFHKGMPSRIALPKLPVQPLYQYRSERRMTGKLTCKPGASITSPGRLRCPSIRPRVLISPSLSILLEIRVPCSPSPSRKSGGLGPVSP